MENKSILVTGGTGSFGNKFIERTIKNFNVKNIFVFSRDEMKQWEMSQKFSDENRIKFIIGDVRDKESLLNAFSGVDYVVHAAATKIVPTAEYNPSECIKTNVIGAMNVIEASFQAGVEKVVALSTDKASNPINLYGASKLASDKLFVTSNFQSRSNKTKFSVVRYGNVMGSRGSIIPFFIKKSEDGILPITHKDMTRFMISLDEAIDLVWRAFEDMMGAEIYVKKIPSIKVMDIAKAISPNSKLQFIGIRPGEKIHEQMIGLEDSPYTFEYDDYFKILPAIYNLYQDSSRVGKGKSVGSSFSYISNKNNKWMTVDNLKIWIKKNFNYDP